MIEALVYVEYFISGADSDIFYFSLLLYNLRALLGRRQ